MYELFCLFACLVVPLLLVLGGIIAYTRRSTRPPPMPNLLPAMRDQIEAWVLQNRLSDEEAAPVLRIVALEIEGPIAVVTADVNQAATIQPDLQAPPVVLAPAPVVPTALPAEQQTAVAATLAAPPAPPTPPQPSRAERLWAGVLALRTRQMLLFLGAFLLVVSSLALVVFRWNSFPPLFQCGLLATVCGLLWGAGEWLERRWNMESAGAGLRAVAGVLAPIVGGAITRLLNIEAHPAWLAVSLLCVVLYVFAARRTEQRLFAVAASLAGASTVLAACGFVSWHALPAALCFALVGYLPLARALQRSAPTLAHCPRWTAHALVPATLAIAAALAQANILGSMALSAALLAGVLFYTTAALLDKRAVWSWAASALGPVAVLTLATELQPDRPALWAMALITTMAVYLVAARLLRTHNLGMLAQAPQTVAHVVVPIALVGSSLLSFGTSEGSLVLWAGLIFYALAIIFQPILLWSLFAAIALPVALVSTCLQFEWITRPTTEALLLALAAAYLVLNKRMLQSKYVALAEGPFAVAHAVVPLVAASMLLHPFTHAPNALILLGAVAFYLLAVQLRQQALWLWPALAIVPFALFASGLAAGWNLAPTWAAVSMLVPAYLALGAAIEPRRTHWFALPAYVLAGMIGFVVGWNALLNGVAIAQWSLPALVVACALFVAITHRKRLQWLGARSVAWLASVVLGTGTVILAAWLWVALDPVMPQTAWRAVALLPLAAAAFVAAQFWLGRLRQGYALSLRIVATTLAFTLALFTLFHTDAGVVGFTMLAAIWTLQLWFQRHSGWATLAFGTAVCAIGFGLNRVGADSNTWIWAWVAVAAVYTLGAAQARNTVWRCLVIPGTAIGTFVGMLSLLTVLDRVLWFNDVQPAYVAAVLVLAALAATHSAIWRRWWLGYLSGPLLAFGVVLAATRGFFLMPLPQVEDYAYVLCGLTVALLALGELLRRRWSRYAAPYEQLGFVLLAAALPLAGFEPQHATWTWLVAALVCGYITFRHRIAWAIVPALLAADAALLFGTGWLLPNGEPSDAGLLLLGATWAQAALALASRRFWAALRPFVYGAAAATAFASLCFAASGALYGVPFYAPVMQVAWGLAALLALLASVERREEVAWAAVGMLALGLACLHAERAVPLAWSLAYGITEALALCVVGWALELAATRGGRFAGVLGVWRRALCEGVLAIGGLLALFVVPFAIVDASLQPLIFGLVMLALLLATVAVRRQRIELGYAAGGALVAAALVQLFQAGVREPQGYALPSGLYLLALADGLRRFQGRRHVARLLECAAIGLVVGTAATQAIQTDGSRGWTLTLLLCALSFVLLGYGVVRRLQVPFVGGAAGFVFGVLWLSVDPLRATNSWIMLGLLGLGLVGLYVLLERRQEQLVRAGRLLIERFNAWE